MRRWWKHLTAALALYLLFAYLLLPRLWVQNLFVVHWGVLVNTPLFTDSWSMVAPSRFGGLSLRVPVTTNLDLDVVRAIEVHSVNCTFLPDGTPELLVGELEDRDYYREVNVFWVPEAARWESLRAAAPRLS